MELESDKGERDRRLEAWRPIKVGAVAQIRRGCVGDHQGCMVVVVARHDSLISGVSRYSVEVIPWEDWSVPAPWMGLDASRQHRGARLDVCRYELTLKGDPEKFQLAKELLDRSVDQVWQDMKDFLDRVVPVDDEEVAHV